MPDWKHAQSTYRIKFRVYIKKHQFKKSIKNQIIINDTVQNAKDTRRKPKDETLIKNSYHRWTNYLIKDLKKYI